jgi:uracil DNA glycosylase
MTATITTATITSRAILVSHRDGSFWATPGDTIEAGLLNGMVEAARWSTKVNHANIAWIEVTDRFVKGEVVGSNERIVVMWGDIPMAAEDELTDWIFENDE